MSFYLGSIFWILLKTVGKGAWNSNIVELELVGRLLQNIKFVAKETMKYVQIYGPIEGKKYSVLKLEVQFSKAWYGKGRNWLGKQNVPLISRSRIFWVYFGFTQASSEEII